ncbi:MAG: hypothetical protein ACD_63C00125G0010 [uncultured bacterium]|nr:MAG: hypothetical protein ACD_63C00125G0010 [uncultured bacterium]
MRQMGFILGKSLEKRSTRVSFIFAVFLFFLTVFTRLPFATKYLFVWDAGTVALGTRHYDIALHQPHPPGYVLYVLFAKLLNYIFGDVNDALVGVSILAAAGAAVFLYLLGKEMYGERVGIIASLFLIFGKIFWAYSEIAVGYTVQCFFAVLVIYLGYRFLKNRPRKYYLYLGSIALAVAGGFRQDLIFFLLPFWIFLTYKFAKDHFWKVWILIAAICFVWFLGMVFWTGGLREYFGALFTQIGYVSGFSVGGRGLLGLVDNYRQGLLFLDDAIKGFSLVIFFAGYLFFPKKIAGDVRLKILLFWILPSAIFYIFVHIGERGYLLTFVPALLVVLAQGLVWFADELRDIFRFNVISSIFLVIISVLIITYNGYFFIGTKEFLSASFLKSQENYIAWEIDHIRAADPARVNFIDEENFKQLHYYLPQYGIYSKSEQVPNDGRLTEDITPK